MQINNHKCYKLFSKDLLLWVFKLSDINKIFKICASKPSPHAWMTLSLVAYRIMQSCNADAHYRTIKWIRRKDWYNLACSNLWSCRLTGLCTTTMHVRMHSFLLIWSMLYFWRLLHDWWLWTHSLMDRFSYM